MHLQTRAVELPLEPCRIHAAECLLDARRGLREHRLDRRERGQPELGEPVGAGRDRRLRDDPQIPGEHERSPDRAGRQARGLRDRVRDDPLQRTLPELAEEERREEALLRLGRPGEEIGELRAARRLRARPCDPRDPRHGRVDFEQLQRRRRLGGGRQFSERRPADPDGALRQHTGEIGDRDAHLTRLGTLETVGEPRHLPEPSARRGDVRGGPGDLLEEHRATLR